MERTHDPRPVEVITVRAGQLELGDIWLSRVGSSRQGTLVGYDGYDNRREARSDRDRWCEVTGLVWGPDHGAAAVWVSDQSVDAAVIEKLLDGTGDSVAQISAALAPHGYVRYQLDGLVEIQTFPYRGVTDGAAS